MAPHNARQRIAIGQADGAIAQSGGRLDHFLRMRGAVQKTEIRNRRQLCKACFWQSGPHGNTHGKTLMETPRA
jgi:hypothetical protein